MSGQAPAPGLWSGGRLQAVTGRMLLWDSKGLFAVRAGKEKRNSPWCRINTVSLLAGCSKWWSCGWGSTGGSQKMWIYLFFLEGLIVLFDVLFSKAHWKRSPSTIWSLGVGRGWSLGKSLSWKAKYLLSENPGRLQNMPVMWWPHSAAKHLRICLLSACDYVVGLTLLCRILSVLLWVTRNWKCEPVSTGSSMVIPGLFGCCFGLSLEIILGRCSYQDISTSCPTHC